MTDVLKIALERRTKLQEEVDKLDDFIRMAESLIRGGGSTTGMSVPTPSATVTPTPTPAPITAPAADSEESPMRAAARRLSETEPRRASDAETSEGTDVPRPSIIRRGLAG